MSLHLPSPLLAVGLEVVIQAIVFLVILASGVAKMFRESKEVQRRAERQQRVPRRPRPEPTEEERVAELQQARAGRPPEAPQETIRSEVEEFLRRVGQEMEGGARQEKRRPPTGQQPRRREPRIEVLGDEDGIGVDNRSRQKHRRPQPARQVSDTNRREPIVSTPAARDEIQRGETVAQHVAEHMKRGEFDERASHLGEDLAQTDERLEARLHQKFDHGLGSLAARRMAREAEDLALKNVRPASSQAADVLKLLSSPQGVQQAVIISEVLKRPTDRW